MTLIFKPPKISLIQPVKEITIGTELSGKILLGGQSAMPFVKSDGKILNSPKIALEISDCLLPNYPEELQLAWGDKINNPIEWAQQAKNLGANLIALRINSSKELNTSPEQIADIAQNIIKTANMPLCILGINNREIDKKYLPVIAKKLNGYNCLIGPVEEETYKEIIPEIRDNGHCVIARTPIDINLAKQLNILITEMGFDSNKILIDPNMGGLGYGLDYGYSVVEKIRIAAFEGDNMLNMPVVVFSGEEAWRTKEAKSSICDLSWGNSKIRSPLWEILTTSAMIMAGADLVIMRHPQSIKYISALLKRLNYDS